MDHDKIEAVLKEISTHLQAQNLPLLRRAADLIRDLRTENGNQETKIVDLEEKVPEWLPIETAPRDGTAFLAWVNDEGHRIAYWAYWFDNLTCKDCEGWRDYYSLDKLPNIDLWQPLINPMEASI